MSNSNVVALRSDGYAEWLSDQVPAAFSGDRVGADPAGVDRVQLLVRTHLSTEATRGCPNMFQSFRKRRTVVGLALVALTPLTVAAAAPAASTGEARVAESATKVAEPAGPESMPDGSVNQQCVAAALETGVDSWTCVGNTLTTAAKSTDGEVHLETTEIAAEFDEQPLLSDAFSPEIVPLASDDYDTWCENGTICARKISNYVAEVKGNGAYGDQNGVIGQVDIIIRQGFNGRWPSWRGLLIHDGGPRVTPSHYVVQCRINKTGPDGYCGTINMFFNPISRTQRRTWAPSRTGSTQNTQRLVGNTKYHDDARGSFKAAGYSQTFHWGVLHTGRWHTCSANCKYYQVPWAD